MHIKQYRVEGPVLSKDGVYVNVYAYDITAKRRKFKGRVWLPKEGGVRGDPDLTAGEFAVGREQLADIWRPWEELRQCLFRDDGVAEELRFGYIRRELNSAKLLGGRREY